VLIRDLVGLRKKEEGESMASQDDLIMPVYLNQRVVFDLVAMMQGGIASVTQVSHTQRERANVVAEVSSQFGLSRALSSLLRIDLSGNVTGRAAGESDETRTEQRIHTPASLFIALRSALHQRQYILQDGIMAKPSPGCIIEFSASLRRNPLAETIKAFVEFLKVADALAEDPTKTKKRDRLSDEQKMMRQMESFLSALAVGDTMDLITEPLKCLYRSVITLEKQYLNDPSMSDLVDGTFRVVGKVTRVIDAGKGAIGLNRKSAMGRLPSSAMEQFRAQLEKPELAAFSFPKMEWDVEGPVIQVLPIAIFS
jgi:hypothetical protein